MKCVVCSGEHDRAGFSTREFAGVPMCITCYHSGAGFAHIYESVITGCRAFGVTVDVWHTGGGCHSFAVSDDIGGWHSILCGLLSGDIATDELAVDVNSSDDWDEDASRIVNREYPAPVTRTVDAVVSWIVSVVRWCRENPPASLPADPWSHVFSFEFGDVAAVRVDTNAAGECRVGWFPNHMVGEDGEVFPSLACGLARVAALVACGDDGGFAHPEPDVFASVYRDSIAPHLA